MLNDRSLSFTRSSMSNEEDECSSWQYLPDCILLHVFNYLNAHEVLSAGQACRIWLRVSYDELLWKDLFYWTWKIDRSISIAPGKDSWRNEYKRLYYHTPLVETEKLKEHSDQVLHVSFSHNGELFASSSKDGFIKVWSASYPATVRFSHDMKQYSWKYTQFSQFNESDSLLLVSGVHFGSHSTSGEIAVFSVIDEFTLQCRVLNKPYDIFGTWYNDEYLLSGNLYWLGQLVSCSALWLNRASQETDSEQKSVVSRLYKFFNANASSIRTIIVSNCLATVDPISSLVNGDAGSMESEQKRRRSLSHEDIHNGNIIDNESSKSEINDVPEDINIDGISDKMNRIIKYKEEYREAENVLEIGCLENSVLLKDDLVRHLDIEPKPEIIYGSLGNCKIQAAGSSTTEDLEHSEKDKFLIFTTGSKTYTPHQIGIKRIKSFKVPDKTCVPDRPSLIQAIDDNINHSTFDDIDHLIDLHGHIIGLGLSPDHRYLYVNSRPWPHGYHIEHALRPPPIAQEIDIHVIDLLTLKEVGTMLRSHKAYTPNDECFFIFLDVCEEYVASGAEDKHGYLWDRHYGMCLAKFPHRDVVNSVAFNPQDSEMLITASDDNMLKIWRSRNLARNLYRQGLFNKKVLLLKDSKNCISSKIVNGTVLTPESELFSSPLRRPWRHNRRSSSSKLSPSSE